MVVTLCAAIGRGAPCSPIGRSPTAQWRQSSNAVRSVIAVVAAAAYCTHATFVSQMASNNGDELDTDLAAAPAKRMRYSFADEIVNGSQFEGFGQRFTGFPSGDCYGKSNRMPPRLDSPRTARKHGGHVPVCVPPGVFPPTPPACRTWRHRFAFFSTVCPTAFTLPCSWSLAYILFYRQFVEGWYRDGCLINWGSKYFNFPADHNCRLLPCKTIRTCNDFAIYHEEHL